MLFLRKYINMFIGSIVLLITGIFAGKFSQAKKEENKQLRETLNRLEDKKDVEEHVHDLSPNDIDRILHNKQWFRK